MVQRPSNFRSREGDFEVGVIVPGQLIRRGRAGSTVGETNFDVQIDNITVDEAPEETFFDVQIDNITVDEAPEETFFDVQIDSTSVTTN